MVDCGINCDKRENRRYYNGCSGAELAFVVKFQWRFDCNQGRVLRQVLGGY